jgi:hypothetical protein
MGKFDRLIYQEEREIAALQKEKDQGIDLTPSQMIESVKAYDRIGLNAMEALIKSYTENPTDEAYNDAIGKINQLDFLNPKQNELRSGILDQLSSVKTNFDREQEMMQRAAGLPIADQEAITKFQTDITTKGVAPIYKSLSEAMTLSKFANSQLGRTREDNVYNLTYDSEDGFLTSDDYKVRDEEGNVTPLYDLKALNDALTSSVNRDNIINDVAIPELTFAEAEGVSTKAQNFNKTWSTAMTKYKESSTEEAEERDYETRVANLNDLSSMQNDATNLLNEFKPKFNDEAYKQAAPLYNVISPVLTKSISEYGKTEKGAIKMWPMDNYYRDRVEVIHQFAQLFAETDKASNPSDFMIMLKDKEKATKILNPNEPGHPEAMNDFIRAIDASIKGIDKDDTEAVYRRLFHVAVEQLEKSQEMGLSSGQNDLFSQWDINSNNWNMDFSRSIERIDESKARFEQGKKRIPKVRQWNFPAPLPK